jgi:hypothetical protein
MFHLVLHIPPTDASAHPMITPDRIPICHRDSLESGSRRRYRRGGHHGTRCATCVRVSLQHSTAQRYVHQPRNIAMSTVRVLQEQSLPFATLTNWSLQCRLSSVRYEINFYKLFSLRASLCCCQLFLHLSSLFFTRFPLLLSSRALSCCFLHVLSLILHALALVIFFTHFLLFSSRAFSCYFLHALSLVTFFTHFLLFLSSPRFSVVAFRRVRQIAKSDN